LTSAGRHQAHICTFKKKIKQNSIHV